MAVRLSKFARWNRLYLSTPKYMISCRSSTSSISENRGDRLLDLMDYYADKPAGMWHQLYHARISFKDYFDDECNSVEGIQLVKDWISIRGYICGVTTLHSLFVYVIY